MYEADFLEDIGMVSEGKINHKGVFSKQKQNKTQVAYFPWKVDTNPWTHIQ